MNADAHAERLGVTLRAVNSWVSLKRMVTSRLSPAEMASPVQAERERIHRELDDIVRERREMAATAENLRAQVERQLRRLQDLSAELAPPAGETEAPAGEAP